MVNDLLHQLFVVWFKWVHDWGYWGVFFLMALESSLVPIPSEIVMPPAAYWASQGRMDFMGVVISGTLGSYFGSIINYWLAQWIGIPFFQKFGRYILLPYHKIRAAENWVSDYGAIGIFIARLLPVMRHLISIPAGLLRMSIYSFSLFTLLGAGLWCFVLSWFGVKILGDNPKLLSSPESLVQTMKEKLIWFVVAVMALGILYLLVLIYTKKIKKNSF